jgi:hypothetical protein
MHKHNLTLSQFYKISFLLFYLIPIITIVFKLFFGMYNETVMEIWVLSLLLIITIVIFLFPKLTKVNKERLIYLSVSAIIFFFGLGAIGFETTYVIVDFSGTEFLLKLPYIIMLLVLVLQLTFITILSYYHKNSTKQKEINMSITMNKTLYMMMGIMVVLGYLSSIVIKLVLNVELKYIDFELSTLSGYVFLYFGLVLLSKFQFKQNLKESFTNSLFFIPIMSIGFAIGIMFFNESFVFFKLTTVISGIVNLVLYLLNLYILNKLK